MRRARVVVFSTLVLGMPLLVRCAHPTEGAAAEHPVVVLPAPAASTSAQPESDRAGTSPAAIAAPAPATPPPSTTAAAEPAPAPYGSSSVVLDRDAWTNQFEAALPVALCNDGTYFRSCFAVTAAECERTAASATRACLRQVRKQLPREFHQPDDGRVWGTKLGACAGTSYDVTLAARKTQSPRCNDPSAWTQAP